MAAIILILAIAVAGMATVSPQTAEAGQQTLSAQDSAALVADDLEGQSTANDLGLVSGHTYIVRSAVRTKAALSVSKASVKDGVNVDVSTFARKLGQQWVIKVNSKGEATIKSVFSRKYLDVAGALAQSKANVQQYRKNGTPAQKWTITRNDNGTYRISSALNPKLSLRVRGATAANGSNVELYRKKNVANQQWRFTDVTSVRNEMDALAAKHRGAVAAGTYVVFSKVSESSVLDIYGGKKSNGANAQIYTFNGGAAQQFRIAYDKKGYVTIRNKSGKYLGVTGARGKDGANVKQYAKDGSLAQKWIACKNADGTMTIHSALWPNLVLDVAGGMPDDSTNVQVYSGNGTDAQKWRFRTLESARKLAKKWAPITALNGTARSSYNGISLAGAKAAGIDVSQWNGNINWNKVAASGIRFAIIRCGYGSNISSQDDYMFLKNVKGARAAGLDIGVYLYSHAVRAKGANSAQSEAEHTLRMLKAAGLTPNKLKYGVYYDVEAPEQQSVNMEPVCKKYCDVMAASGYTNVGVYASLSWWNTKLTGSSFNNWNKWIAQWPYKTGGRKCDYGGSFQIWQCMSDGSVPGIVGRVDMDLAY